MSSASTPLLFSARWKPLHRREAIWNYYDNQILFTPNLPRSFNIRDPLMLRKSPHHSTKIVCRFLQKTVIRERPNITWFHQATKKSLAKAHKYGFYHMSAYLLPLHVSLFFGEFPLLLAWFSIPTGVGFNCFQRRRLHRLEIRNEKTPFCKPQFEQWCMQSE